MQSCSVRHVSLSSLTLASVYSHPSTALIIETSYLTDICIYAPSLCTWNIKSMWHVIFKRKPFYQISLCASPVYMVKLRAFIFGIVMHSYWGYHKKEIMHLSIIFLKLWISSKISICTFLAHLTFMPRILSL